MSPALPSTLSIQSASEVCWDTLVIGGGPAGAMAAHQIAQLGLQVLLVERNTFPRDKVCGCCLNGAALHVLQRVGMQDIPRGFDAPPIDTFEVFSRTSAASVAVPAGVAISREKLDAELVRRAVAAGASFLDNTQALIDGSDDHARTVLLKSQGVEKHATARLVILAGGLGVKAFVDESDFGRVVIQDSRIGAGTKVSTKDVAVARGTIYMACDPRGYVGMVQLEDDRVDLAAALDRDSIVSHKGIANLARGILEDCGMPAVAEVTQAKWNGTPKLTQRRLRPFEDRVLTVGDAAGYIEPFTGEGMAWALATGMAVAPFARESIARGTATTGPAWQKRRTALLGRRRRSCYLLSRLLRSPRLASAGIRTLSFAPVLAKPFVNALNSSYAVE